jgi:hypothetical protein
LSSWTSSTAAGRHLLDTAQSLAWDAAQDQDEAEMWEKEDHRHDRTLSQYKNIPNNTMNLQEQTKLLEEVASRVEAIIAAAAAPSLQFVYGPEERVLPAADGVPLPATGSSVDGGPQLQPPPTQGVLGGARGPALANPSRPLNGSVAGLGVRAHFSGQGPLLRCKNQKAALVTTSMCRTRMTLPWMIHPWQISDPCASTECLCLRRPAEADLT